MVFMSDFCHYGVAKQVRHLLHMSGDARPANLPRELRRSPWRDKAESDRTAVPSSYYLLGLGR